MKKKSIVLIIISILILIGLVIYGVFYYNKERKVTRDLNPTIVNLQQKSDYIPDPIGNIVDLSDYKVDSIINDLSDGSKQYISTFQTINLPKTFQDLKSQISKAGYSIGEEDDKTFYLEAFKGNVVIQVFSVGVFSSSSIEAPMSSSTVIISLNGEK